MAIECYYVSGSPWAWRVMLALAYKGIEFEHKVLEFSRGDLETPEYIAMNPHKQVPVLRDGDVVLYESGAILAYLDRKYPENPIFGTSAEEAGFIHQRALESQNHLMAPMASVLRPIFQGRAEEHKEQIEEGLAKIPEALAMVASWLEAAPYIAGKDISAADMTLYPGLAMIQRVLGGPLGAAYDTSAFLPLGKQFSAVGEWMQRVEAMPRFNEVYPPHWKEAA